MLESDKSSYEVSKSQTVRLLDVFVLGPGTILAGIAAGRPLPPWARIALIAYGVATVHYNAKNYLSTKRMNRLPKPDEEMIKRT